MTTTISKTWLNVSRNRPCVICNKGDRCKYTDDGAHRCFRSTDAPAGYRRVKICKDGTAVFRLDDEPTRPRRRTSRQTAALDWAAEATRFQTAMTSDRQTDFARQLGVTTESLELIGYGWASVEDLRWLKVSGDGWQENYPDGAYSVPEYSGDEIAIGLGFRAVDGRKGAASEAKRGLTLPKGWRNRPGPIVIVEGPSDVAASLTMGVNAIGRPSNRGGTEHLAVLLKDREFIVVGENDARLVEGRGMVWPGAEGAQAVGAVLASKFDKPIRVAMPPKPLKDARAYLNARVQDLVNVEACHAAGSELMAHLTSDVKEVQPTPPSLDIHVDHKAKRSKACVTARVDGSIIVVDDFNIQSDKRRTEFAQKITAKEPRLGMDDVQAILLNAVHAPRSEAEPPQSAPSREALLEQYDEQVEQFLDEMPEETVQQAEQMLADPALINLILHDIQRMGVVGEQQLALTIHLIGVSRLLLAPDRPEASIVQGLTSTGKSFTIDKVGTLFPNEAVLRATDITPQALFYMPPGGLIHRLVIAGERSRREDSDRAEATRALREMISAGYLSKMVTMKIGGRLESRLIRQDGPIAFVESTTLTNLFDEDANRCLLLGTDESKDQTQRVIKAEASRSQGNPPDSTAILLRHHALQRILRRVRVTVPFAERLADSTPSDSPNARRAFSHALSLIKTVTLLHQRQRADRPLDHGDTIEATLIDYRIARHLLIGPLGRALGGALPDAVANLAKRLMSRYGGEVFTTTKAAAEDRMITSRSKMGQYLKTLAAAGTAEHVTPPRGNQPSEWKIVADPPEAGAKWLPEADQLECCK